MIQCIHESHVNKCESHEKPSSNSFQHHTTSCYTSNHVNHIMTLNVNPKKMNVIAVEMSVNKQKLLQHITVDIFSTPYQTK